MSEDPEVEALELEPGKPESVFRDQVIADNLAVFLDLEFFGELHHVAGHMIRVVIDDDVNHQIGVARDYGVTDTGFVMFARESDLDRQLQGSQLEIDGRLYTVLDWRVDEGMSRITLLHIAAY